MQYLAVFGRFLFVALIYLFLLRILTVMLADLRSKGILPKTESDFGCLEVLNGSGMLAKGRKIRVDSQGLTIGRGQYNDIIIPDHYCSLQHAELKYSKGITTIEDRLEPLLLENKHLKLKLT